jgi:hypothetical protein
MVRSGGGIEWLILIYIYYTKIYVTLYSLKCIANFEFQKLLQNSRNVSMHKSYNVKTSWSS